MIKQAVALWLIASCMVAAEEGDRRLCSEQDVIQGDVLLPDAVPFELGHSAQTLSDAFGCSLYAEGGTRSTGGAESTDAQALVAIDGDSLALLEVLGPSPETEMYARELDAAVFEKVAALSDRRAIVFISSPAGAEIFIGGTSYGVTTRVMGVRSGVIQQARLVLPGHAECSYAEATVRMEADGTETVSCDLTPLQ